MPRSQALSTQALSAPRWNNSASPLQGEPPGVLSCAVGAAATRAGLPAQGTQGRRPQGPSLPKGSKHVLSADPRAPLQAQQRRQPPRERQQPQPGQACATLGPSGAANWVLGGGRAGAAPEGPGLEPAPPGPLPCAPGRAGMGLTDCEQGGMTSLKSDPHICGSPIAELTPLDPCPCQ